jgi:hypothetical protein
MNEDFPVFLFWQSAKTKMFVSCPLALSLHDLHRKRSPLPDFRERGVIVCAAKGGQKQMASWEASL